MVTTDPIADMLTRIRNAQNIKKESVLIPLSKEKKAIADILLSAGYVSKVELDGEGSQKNIKVVLKYGPNGEKTISGLKRISKPGLRIYASCQEMPKVLNGLGIAIVSTSEGIMTDKLARKNKIGGEVLAFIW